MAADLDALVALESSSFATDRLSRASWRRLIGRPSADIRVVDGAEGLQAAAIVLSRAGSKRARLYSIAVHPRAAGKGLGRALLAEIEQVARERGAQVLSLEVRVDNSAAIALYERAGFRKTGRREGYYADGADALRFEKAI